MYYILYTIKYTRITIYFILISIIISIELCNNILCYAMLCYAILCYAMLYHAMLGYTIRYDAISYCT